MKILVLFFVHCLGFFTLDELLNQPKEGVHQGGLFSTSIDDDHHIDNIKKLTFPVFMNVRLRFKTVKKIL